MPRFAVISLVVACVFSFASCSREAENRMMAAEKKASEAVSRAEIAEKSLDEAKKQVSSLQKVADETAA